MRGIVCILSTNNYMTTPNHDWEFYQDTEDNWRWRTTATNGQITGAASEGFASKESAQRNAELVGYNNIFGAYKEINWQFYNDAESDWRWRLTADNGQIVAAASQGYKNRSDCEYNAAIFGHGR